MTSRQPRCRHEPCSGVAWRRRGYRRARRRRQASLQLCEEQDDVAGNQGLLAVELRPVQVSGRPGPDGRRPWPATTSTGRIEGVGKAGAVGIGKRAARCGPASGRWARIIPSVGRSLILAHSTRSLLRAARLASIPDCVDNSIYGVSGPDWRVSIWIPSSRAYVQEWPSPGGRGLGRPSGHFRI